MEGRKASRVNSRPTTSPETAFRTPQFMRLAIYMANVVEWNPLIGFVELKCFEDQNPADVVGHVLRAGKLVNTR